MMVLLYQKLVVIGHVCTPLSNMVCGEDFPSNSAGIQIKCFNIGC